MDEARRIDLLLVAHSLAVGGAERQLVVLAKTMQARGYQVAVAVLRGGGELEEELRAAGVRLLDLQGKSRRWSPAILLRFIRAARNTRPAVVHSYLSLPNVLVVLLRAWLPPTRVIWGVRAAFVDYRGMRRLFRWADALERRLAFLPDVIVCNSRAGKRHAVAKGYPESRITVIPNGIDTDRFRRSEQGRARVRAAWQVGTDEWLVGIVARLDPLKDHPTLLRAAALVAGRMPNAKFVCVGAGDADWWSGLRDLAAALGVEGRVIWAGERHDMPEVYSALDVLCLTSRGEGFPNAIGEAMACGVPCVATDVGDVAWIIGDQGVVVEPGNPAALAGGIESVLARLAGQAPAMTPRERIVREFAVAALCDAMETLLPQ